MISPHAASAAPVQLVVAFLPAVLSCALFACSQAPSPAAGERAAAQYDWILAGGTVYDGSGTPPVVADVGLRGDRVAAVGDLSGATAGRRLDVSGLAVAPGFVNVLSWATESLLADGRAMSDLKQGVTLEVFGEGLSMGPLSPELATWLVERQSDVRYDVAWTTLGEYLEHLERRGVAPNVASFVGATTLRAHVIGFDDRPPTPEELARMEALTVEAMEEGALGVGSSLIYAPAFYASTEELVALARVAGRYGGRYISHLRSEGDHFLDALDELLTIAREADVAAEVYHLKAAGRDNWGKLDEAIRRIEAARAEGLDVTADMYTYTAGSTGLDAVMPPWVQAGGYEAWSERLNDPEVRARVKEEMLAPENDWENFYRLAGPEGILLVAFKNHDLRRLQGKTLAEVAAARGRHPAEVAMDLVIEDGSRVGAVFFLMSEENVRRQIALPWITFGSDAGAPAAEGVFLETQVHPRAYGNFARLLGRYVREERVIPLAEAIRRLTSLPAENFGIEERGRLVPGHFADVVVFDPATITDHATFEDPHRYATGVGHVFVNGTPALLDGEPTGELPGRVVRGPGWSGRSEGRGAGEEW